MHDHTVRGYFRAGAASVCGGDGGEAIACNFGEDVGGWVTEANLLSVRYGTNIDHLLATDQWR